MRRVTLLASLILLGLMMTGAGTVAAMPRTCGGTTIVDELPCCVSGVVTLNGAPVRGAEVRASNDQAGAEALDITDYATKWDPYPTYGFLLDGPELQAEPGDVVTLTATYQGYTRSVSFVVVEGEQTVDIMLDGIIGEQFRAQHSD